MGKTLLYWLVGAGRISRHLRPRLEAEGIILIDEGIGGAITYQDFRAPGKAVSWKRSWFSGAVVLTNRRFLALAYWQQIINLPYDDARLAALQISQPDAETLHIAFDAATFHDDWSGAIECQFSTVYARQIQARLSA